MAEAVFQVIKACLQRKDADALVTFFEPLSEDTQQLALRASLKAQPNGNKAMYVKLGKKYLDDPWFAALCAEYLLYLRNSAFSNAESYMASYKSLEATFMQARHLFQKSDKQIYIPLIRRLAFALVMLAFKADKVANDNKNVCASSASRILQATAGLAASGDPGPKRMAVLFLANALLRIYFHLKTPRLAAIIHKLVGDAADRLDEFPKSDQVEFLYYLGRMSLFDRKLREAASYLELAWLTCQRDDVHNQRLILIYLTAARLPLGVFPTYRLLAAYNLEGPFWPLVEAIKQAHFAAVEAHLERWQAFHLKSGTLLLLREKLEVICWRNLVRKTLWITDSPPSNPNKTPTLRLDVLARAARVAFGQEDLDEDDVECMVVSLIDQGYLKAYIWHARGVIVFQKAPLFGFPPVTSVRHFAPE